ncbi:MAG: dTDP-4-dehydrorhamnose 3,5-epimerase [Candidatus Epulonipiscioides saccharophilum]|nr:MAG: dTDP-4-dehydrorhamnose 3,5-epimerase [Epulopiscium sp. AS2M-Bin001]
MFNFKYYDDVIELDPMVIEDKRGYFMKSYEKEIFAKHGIVGEISENISSYSTKGVLRGMHFQSKNPQIKILRVAMGEIVDVVVDIRKNSPTFKKWYKFNLSSENKKMIVVPAGFAHGFLTLSDIAIVSYSCIGKYLKEYDTGIVYNDKDINIEWPFDLVNEIIISDKDKSLPTLAEMETML